MFYNILGRDYWNVEWNCYYKPLVVMCGFEANYFASCIQHITQMDITGYQVDYNGTMMNVTSSTTALTFTAPSLPDGVFSGAVAAMVTAISRYGVGPASETETAVVTGVYICGKISVSNMQ